MALAALIISILAALFTGWQALVAQQANKVESERRLDERRPSFEPTIKRIDDDGLYQLTLELKSHWPLSGLTVTAKDLLSIGFLPDEDRPKRTPQPAAVTRRPKGDWPYPLHLGSEASWRFVFFKSPSVPPKLVIRVASYQGKDKWETLLDVEMPRIAKLRYIED